MIVGVMKELDMSEFDARHSDGPSGGSFQQAMACISRYAICGAVGFGVGSVFPFFGFFLPGPLGFVGMIFGFALNGFMGGMAIALCAGAGSGTVLPGIAFGVGFLPTAVMVMVTMVAEVGGSEALLYSASGCAVGYGIAGVIGTPVLGFSLGLRRLRTLAFLLLAGGVALGIGGAVGGVALVVLGSAAHPFRGLAGIPIAGAISGALLGAILLPAGHIESG